MLTEVSEAEVPIEGCVPRDLGERGERDGRQARVRRPGADALEKRPADASTLMIRPNGHLLDVRASVDHVDEHVADRHIAAVDGDPRPPARREAGKRLQAGRLVVGHLGQADVAKPLTGAAFDLSKHRAVRGLRWPDGHRHAGILAAAVCSKVFWGRARQPALRSRACRSPSCRASSGCCSRSCKRYLSGIRGTPRSSRSRCTPGSYDIPTARSWWTSGVGTGHQLIDEWYRPRGTAIGDTLDAVGIDVDEVVGLVLSHLHFDHCGQQSAFDCPTYVQAHEHEAAQARGYTVPEWAAIPKDRLRVVDGDGDIAEGVRLLATPGHTPGHQSVLVEAGGDRVVLAAQCAFAAAELRSGVPAPSNLHDETWTGPARESLRRVRSLAPVTCHLSHHRHPVLIER